MIEQVLGQPVPLMTENECLDRIREGENEYNIAVIKWERIVRHYEWGLNLYNYHAHGKSCSLYNTFVNCRGCLVVVSEGVVCNKMHSLWHKYVVNKNISTAKDMLRMLKKIKKLNDYEQSEFKQILSMMDG